MSAAGSPETEGGDPVAAVLAAMRGPTQGDELGDIDALIEGFLAVVRGTAGERVGVGRPADSGLLDDRRALRHGRRLSRRTGVAVLAAMFVSAGVAAAGSGLLPVPFIAEHPGDPVDPGGRVQLPIVDDVDSIVVSTTAGGEHAHRNPEPSRPSSDATRAYDSNDDDIRADDPSDRETPTASVVAVTGPVVPAQPGSATTPNSTTPPKVTPSPGPSVTAPGQGPGDNPSVTAPGQGPGDNPSVTAPGQGPGDNPSVTAPGQGPGDNPSVTAPGQGPGDNPSVTAPGQARGRP